MKEDIGHRVRMIRQVWIPLLAADERLRQPIAETLGHLEAIEALAQHGANPKGTSDAGRTEPDVDTAESSVSYGILTSEEGEVLAEYHGDTKYPYRVPHAIYMAAAQVLDGEKKPLYFEQLRAGVAKRLKQQTVPDYLVRVPVRLWLRERALVRESRKYSPAVNSLVNKAKEMWDSIPRKRG